MLRFLSFAVVAALAAASICTGCGVFASLPRSTGLKERLRAMPTRDLPLNGRVAIHWDRHQIPFIEAEHDEDLAFALGLVHAHLRLGQMEFFRRVVRGRLTESGGPFALEIDHAIRIIDLDRAVPQMARDLPPDTRAWVRRFVDGVNVYVARASTHPLEFSVLNLEREPWTVEDVLAIGRLASVDVTWLAWLSLLPYKGNAEFDAIWQTVARRGAEGSRSFGPAPSQQLQSILGGFSRSGSNSIVVSKAASATGSALMANDPHLGLFVPNFWVIGGYRSPGYHCVGLMVPGVPVVALGRNPHIAWGGTNMRAASSDLIDLSSVESATITGSAEALKVRWWFDDDVEIRQSPYGPVFTDIPFLNWGDRPPLALRWVGHQPSDELSALLAVNRASNFAQFRSAFRTYAVAGQNYLYADTTGNIGQLMAVRLPKRPLGARTGFIVTGSTVASGWNDIAGAAELPAVYNPQSGFIVSANNPPTDADRPIGFFFPPSDRVDRLEQLVSDAKPVRPADLRRIQMDVYLASADALKQTMLKAGAPPDAPEALAAYEILAGWNGEYRANTAEPVVFEAVFDHLLSTTVMRTYGETVGAFIRGHSHRKIIVGELLNDHPLETWQSDVWRGLVKAVDVLKKYPTWGDMHRLVVGHPLAQAPLIGDRYRFVDVPASGASDTINKTDHATTVERHATRFGAQARHISDLSHPDENYFVLLGGQDGWFNSETFTDQVELFLRGDFVQVPLSPTTFANGAVQTMQLEPTAATE